MSLSSHRGTARAARSRAAGRGAAAEAGAAVEVLHLRKTYGAAMAVDDVSFSVAEGEIFGILGPNGAGKTTTVECATGLRTPDAGVMRVMGLDPGTFPSARLLLVLAAWAAGFGFLAVRFFRWE